MVGCGGGGGDAGRGRGWVAGRAPQCFRQHWLLLLQAEARSFQMQGGLLAAPLRTLQQAAGWERGRKVASPASASRPPPPLCTGRLQRHGHTQPARAPVDNLRHWCSRARRRGASAACVCGGNGATAATPTPPLRAVLYVLHCLMPLPALALTRCLSLRRRCSPRADSSTLLRGASPLRNSRPSSSSTAT